MTQYQVNADDIIILDCYKTHKWNMRKDLKTIQAKDGNRTIVFKHRSIFSMKMEWICHKFLYLVGYERERTKDADLDWPCDRPEWQYIVCGMLVWLFVW